MASNSTTGFKVDGRSSKAKLCRRIDQVSFSSNCNSSKNYNYTNAVFLFCPNYQNTSERMPSEHCARMTRNTIANKSCMTNNLRWLLKSLCMQGANNKEERLQTDHNSAAEFMGRICKSHRVITSQISGVKPQWENTAATSLFVPPSKPHDKDFITSVLRASD